MTISYEEALKEARKREAFERAEYNYIRQQRDDWEKYRTERRKDPHYSPQERESDNVTSYEMGQREVKARNQYENAQTNRLELEQMRDEISRQNEQKHEHGQDDNQIKDNEQASQRKDNDNGKDTSQEKRQQQKDRERKFEHTK